MGGTTLIVPVCVSVCVQEGGWKGIGECDCVGVGVIVWVDVGVIA